MDSIQIKLKPGNYQIAKDSKRTVIVNKETGRALGVIGLPVRISTIKEDYKNVRR